MEVLHAVGRPFRLATSVVRILVRMAVQYAPVARALAVVVLLLKSFAVVELARARLPYG